MEAIYTGSGNGQFIQSPAIQMPDGYNPTERDWYKEAVKKSGEVIVTAPYKSKRQEYCYYTSKTKRG